MQTYSDYIGIDISKDTFDVVTQSGRHTKYNNTPKDFLKFTKTITSGSICVMEYTGIYYLNLAKYLYKKDINVSVVNPLIIKRFIQLKLRRNKTDKSDAQMISLYGKTQELSLWQPEPEVIEHSKDTIQVMEQFIEFRSGLKNKLAALNIKIAPKELFNFIKEQILSITKTIDKLQKKINELVRSYNPEMLTNIRSIVGIGERTAGLLIVMTEGFKSFENSNQLSSYFGLAPTEASSGTSIKGKGSISKMGNPLVRKKLYMCSLQASKHNKSCIALYNRLLDKGKPKKVALIAVANKLLKIVLAIAKSGIPYDREYKSVLLAM